MCFLMIILYISSIGFSSFFSYVYISNEAYEDVRPTDYNMELELFLVDNTRTIREYNDTIGDMLIEKIRQTAPKFSALMESYHQVANDKIQEITGNLQKYEVNMIPPEMEFSAQEAITAYEGPNGRPANSDLQEDCKRLERDINNYVDYYNTQYYSEYSRYYDKLQDQMDSTSIDSRIKEIDILIESMNHLIDNMKELKYVYTSIGSYITTKCNGIISQYNFLIDELNKLKTAYSEIQNHPDVLQQEGLTLQSFYEVVYSDELTDEENLDNARNNLQQIITAYIRETDDIDTENITSLVECVKYLEQLSQSRELSDRIEVFETVNLQKSYAIISETSKNESSDESATDPTEYGGQISDEELVTDTTESEDQTPDDVTVDSQPLVDKEKWKEIRHADVMEFISLIKGLPDAEKIIQQGDPGYEALAEKKDYVSKTLAEAYEYSRAKLENISDLERAWNYLSSPNSFLAFFCVFIAVFLDFASFLIGIYLFAGQEIDKKKEE